MNIVSSFLSCSTLHYFARYLPLRTPQAPNLITCIGFQLFFIGNAARLSCHNPPTLLTSEQTLHNLDYIYGYFLYDLGYLLHTQPSSFFIIHHLIGIGILHCIQYIGAPVSVVSEYNFLCLIVELINPLLNLLPFVKQTPYYPFFLRMIYDLYLVFRIILFPISSYRLMEHVPRRMWVFFGLVYGMNLFWAKKMRGMVMRL